MEFDQAVQTELQTERIWGSLSAKLFNLNVLKLTNRKPSSTELS